MNWLKDEFFIIFCLLMQVSFCAEVPEKNKYEECAPDKEVCEYWLLVKEILTMIYGKKKLMAARENCTDTTMITSLSW